MEVNVSQTALLDLPSAASSTIPQPGQRGVCYAISQAPRYMADIGACVRTKRNARV
jgi:hypothetical protein